MESSDVLVTADLRGVESHGVSNMLRRYVEFYQDEVLNPLGKLTIISDTPSAATVDVDWSIGDTYKLAVDAGTTAAVTVTHSNIADKVIILAVHNTSSTTALSLTLPSAIGNSSLSSTTMPVSYTHLTLPTTPYV